MEATGSMASPTRSAGVVFANGISVTKSAIISIAMATVFFFVRVGRSGRVVWVNHS